MLALAPDETLLVGGWSATSRGVEADAICQRITALVEGGLVLLAASPDGWARLFRDPSDGRLWELTHPQSAMHGGGPPCLRNITDDAAFVTYGSF
jgi:Immunity protein 27